jgi:hypothetical protein
MLLWENNSSFLSSSRSQAACSRRLHGQMTIFFRVFASDLSHSGAEGSPFMNHWKCDPMTQR